MDKELVIQSTSKGSDIALLEDKRLVELHHENADAEFLVGDIYVGRVRKLLPGLNAAFIDIGHKRDAFLHYLDLGPNVRSQLKYFSIASDKRKGTIHIKDFRFEPEIEKSGKIPEVLKQGQPIVVQIVKEPISTKGPRLSSQLSLPGRYLILMPFSNSIAISKRIKSREERDRLRKLIISIKPQNFGVIVRTIAEGKLVADLDKDLRNLVKKWDMLVKNVENHKSRLLGELDKTESILRDLLNDSFSKILVDNEEYQFQLKDYIQKIAPERESIVKLYRGQELLFRDYGIERQIKSLFGKIVNLTGGAYLVIEHTEAMHVINVNSGSRRMDKLNQEENALNINIEAAEEVSRQLRLRDIGGIIVVDFIDMRNMENKKKLYERMKELLKLDRAKSSILPLSKFGLAQITRQRVRPEININTTKTCPYCKGTGEANPNILVVDEIYNRLSRILKTYKNNTLHIVINPFVHSYLTKGLFTLQLKWMWHFRKWIKLTEDENYFITKYKILDAKEEEINN